MKKNILLPLLLLCSLLQAQTYFDMSSGNYSENFDDIANTTNWPNGFNGPSSTEWQGFAVSGSGAIPNGTNLTTQTLTFSTGASGGVQRGTNAIMLLSTGSSDNTTSAAINLLLNFTGRTAGTISFTWAQVNNGSIGDNRTGSVRVYTSIDGVSYTELSAASVLNVVNFSGATGSVTTVALPAAFNNAANARIRFYYHNGTGGTGGSRPKIAIDNLAVTSTPSGGPTYTINASAGANGSISPSGAVVVSSGASQNFTITPSGGYAVQDVLVDLVSVGAVSSYNFPNITADHTISASFVAIPYTITTSFLIPNFICPGGAVAVPYTVSTAANAGNVFTAELSDSVGSFASPTSIGSVSSTTSGSIAAIVPANTPNGTGYRIRVVGSNPAATGNDNSQNITIQYNTISPVFVESMGSVGGTTTIAAHEAANGFDNDGFTMSGTADIRNTLPSSGYTGASGAANVFFSNTPGRTLRIDGISTLGLSPLVLSFGLYKDQTADNGSGLWVEVSADGGATFSPPYPLAVLPTGPGTAVYHLVKLAGAVPASNNVSIRFTQTSTTTQYRLDDLAVYSGTATTPAVSPVGPLVQCGGSVTLNASPSDASYLWTGGAITPSATYSASGSYSVTITDGFGCASVQGPVSVTINTAAVTSVGIFPAVVCAGSVMNFNAAASNGGASPVYDWKLNNVSVGAGSSYLSPVLNEGDMVQCFMTSSLSCVTASPVPSNPVVAQGLAHSPATAWTEDFGTTGGSGTPLNAYTGYSNGQGFTFSGDADVRQTGVLFSGSHLFFNVNGKYCTISGINTTATFPNNLSFYMLKSTNLASGSDFKIEYSIDGVTFYNIPFSLLPTGTGTSDVWYLKTITGALPAAPNVRLRFTNNNSASTLYRIDQLVLTGYSTDNAAISPAGPTTLCSPATVNLTVTPATGIYGWSTFETSQSITTGTAGIYTVTVADVFGCTSSASHSVSVLNPVMWYLDADGDGYDAGTSFDCYSPPGLGWSTTPSIGSGDCNDANSAINPGATEICGNFIDENCNGGADDVDNTDPVIADCPGNITVTAPLNASSIPVSWIPPTASDNCILATFFWSHNPGDNFPLGVTTVTYQAFDMAGNNTTCAFDVVVCASVDFNTSSIQVNCPQFTATLNAVTAGVGYTYQWYNNNFPISGATAATLNINTTGNYRVNIASGSCNSPSPTKWVNHPTPLLDTTGYVYKCAGNSFTINVAPGSLGISYQWRKTDAPAGPVGTNSPTFSTSIPGNYVCDITYAGGCTKRTSSMLKLRDVPWACPPAKTDEAAAEVHLLQQDASRIVVNTYPVPANAELNVEVKNADSYNLSLIDFTGRIVSSEAHETAGTYTLDVSTISSGMYVLQLQSGSQRVSQRIVIEH